MGWGDFRSGWFVRFGLERGQTALCSVLAFVSCIQSVVGALVGVVLSWEGIYKYMYMWR